MTEQMPFELLAAVFGELALSDRVAPSLVSKRWRSAMLDTPSIWKGINCISTSSSFAGFLQKLQYSGRSTIDLTMELSVFSQVLEGAISENVDRCNRLKIVFGNVPDAAGLDMLRHALSYHAPILKRLSLTESWALVAGLVFAAHFALFSGHAPKLHHVHLACNIQSLAQMDNAAFANVTTVDWSQTDINMIVSTNLSSLFKLFPRVVYLKIAIMPDWWGGERNTTAHDALDVVPAPAALRSLDLLTSSAMSLDWFRQLNLLSWHHLLRVAINADSGDIADESLITLFQTHSKLQPLHCAWIGWVGSPSFLPTGVAVTFGNGEMHRMLARGSCPPEQSRSMTERTMHQRLQPLPASLFVNITHLYLHELLFDTEAFPPELPSFPAVVKLTVMLMSDHFWWNDLGTSPLHVRYLLLPNLLRRLNLISDILKRDKRR